MSILLNLDNVQFLNPPKADGIAENFACRQYRLPRQLKLSCCSQEAKKLFISKCITTFCITYNNKLITYNCRGY